MKEKRCFLSFLVLLVLTAGLLTAGGSAEEGKSGGQKKLTVWSWNPEFNGYSMKEAAKIYEKNHPDVTIDLVNIPENIEGKIEAGLMAGGKGLPDIALFQDFNVEKFIYNYPGSFVDLRAEGIDFSHFAQYKVGPMTDKGGVYGIPFDSGSIGLYLRADILKASGLTPEDYLHDMTWDDVIEVGKVVRAETGTPLMAYDSTGMGILHAMLQSTNAQFFDRSGKLTIDTPEMKKCLQYLKTMHEEGLLAMVEGWSNYVSAFNNGDSAGVFSAVWMISVLKTQPDNAGKWIVIPTPRVAGVPEARNASNYGGSSWFVFEKSKNRDLAVDFLKTSWASDNQDVLGFYNTILKGAGAMGTFLPSRSGTNYKAGDDFFYKGQAVYNDFAAWMEDVPILRYTPHYFAMSQAVNNSVNLMLSQGRSIDETIAAAEAEYKQITGK